MYYIHVEYLLPPMVGNDYTSDTEYPTLERAMRVFDEHVRLASLSAKPAITYVDLQDCNCRIIASWKCGVNS